MNDNEIHEIIDLDPQSSSDGHRWVVRSQNEPAPDGSWAEVKVDIDPNKITNPESFVDDFPAPRKAQVVVGDFEKLCNLLAAADKVRTRFLRRDLRWISSVIHAADMEVILVRDAREDD